MDGSTQAADPLKRVTGRDTEQHGTGASGQKEKDQGRKDTCSICLEHITERAIAYPCNHVTFDFICLASWLQEQDTCPLCKAKILEVQYDWQGPEEYKAYQVPAPKAPAASSTQEATSRGRRSNRPPRLPAAPNSSPLTLNDPALERRRHVYRSRLYALYVGSNRISGYRDLTPSTIVRAPELQSRARAFLRRELRVFGFLDTAVAPRRSNREFLVEYIVGVLRTQDLRSADSKAEELLKDYLGRENARMLLHELEAWMKSPFARLEEWDEVVQYMDERGVHLLKDIGREKGPVAIAGD